MRRQGDIRPALACRTAPRRALFGALTVVIGAALPACGGPPSTPVTSQSPMELLPLGEPKRNIRYSPPSLDDIKKDVESYTPKGRGFVGVMAFVSNSAFVENIYAPVADESTCTSAFIAYDNSLKSQHGPGKIKHGLYCIAVADGKAGAVNTVVKSY